MNVPRPPTLSGPAQSRSDLCFLLLRDASKIFVATESPGLRRLGTAMAVGDAVAQLIIDVYAGNFSLMVAAGLRNPCSKSIVSMARSCKLRRCRQRN
jgi:hypothetical protein